jgi:hypothetical protein
MSCRVMFHGIGGQQAARDELCSLSEIPARHSDGENEQPRSGRRRSSYGINVDAPTVCMRRKLQTVSRSQSGPDHDKKVGRSHVAQE